MLRTVDLGNDVSYAAGMARMRAAIDLVDLEGPVLLLLEHSPVVTITRQGGREWVRSTDDELRAAGIELVETDRGGDVTFHGPGQLVGYPIVRLPPSQILDGRVDLLGYLRALELALLDACAALGVEGCHTKSKMTGVWVASDPTSPADLWPDDEDAKKLVAIGVGVNDGVTRHGFALNLSTDLERFTRHIVPCGLEGRGVTSLAQLMPSPPSLDQVKRIVSEEVSAALAVFFSGAGTSDATLPALREESDIGEFAAE